MSLKLVDLVNIYFPSVVANRLGVSEARVMAKIELLDEALKIEVKLDGADLSDADEVKVQNLLIEMGFEAPMLMKAEA